MYSSENNKYHLIFKTADVLNRIINFLCVVLVTVQLIVILIMVFGRYFFNYVPSWVEQFALFCMIWFAMFSVSLGVRDDSHVKVEVIDHFTSPRSLFFVRMFANVCTALFGIVMVQYGIKLSALAWTTRLSAFKVPMGLQYMSTVAGGIFIIFNAFVCSLELYLKYKEMKRRNG